MTRVLLNGESRELADASPASALRALGVAVDRGGIAVAVNGAVVPRSEWTASRLADGDEVEVLTAVQGG